MVTVMSKTVPLESLPVQVNVVPFGGSAVPGQSTLMGSPVTVRTQSASLTSRFVGAEACTRAAIPTANMPRRDAMRATTPTINPTMAVTLLPRMRRARAIPTIPKTMEAIASASPTINPTGANHQITAKGRRANTSDSVPGVFRGVPGRSNGESKNPRRATGSGPAIAGPSKVVWPGAASDA